MFSRDGGTPPDHKRRYGPRLLPLWQRLLLLAVLALIVWGSLK
ncbi:hypothetical protein [Streptomyces misionensis]